MSFKFTGLDQLEALKVQIPQQIYQEVDYRRKQIKENEAKNIVLNTEKAYKTRISYNNSDLNTNMNFNRFQASTKPSHIQYSSTQGPQQSVLMNPNVQFQHPSNTTPAYNYSQYAYSSAQSQNLNQSIQTAGTPIPSCPSGQPLVANQNHQTLQLAPPLVNCNASVSLNAINNPPRTTSSILHPSQSSVVDMHSNLTPPGKRKHQGAVPSSLKPQDSYSCPYPSSGASFSPYGRPASYFYNSSARGTSISALSNWQKSQ